MGKKNLANHVKLRDSLKSQIANLQGDLDKQSGKLSKEKAASAAEAAKVSTKEASMKQAIKKVKATLKKADVHLMSDKEKAYAAKMLTASSKEKLAKVLLAKAKVSNWEAQTELGHVITDKQRVDAEA